MDGSTKAVFEKFGVLHPSGNVKIVPADEMLIRAWESGKRFAILPFDQLEAAWKVLTIDGDFSNRKEF